MTPMNSNENGECILPANEFASPKAGYVFAGWKYGDKVYKPGDTITLTDLITEAFAVWEPVPEDIGGEGVWGDVTGDGEVKMNDAVLLMQSISNADKYGLSGSDSTHITQKGQYWGDVESNGNGITPKDALQIQKYLVELVDTLEPKNE